MNKDGNFTGHRLHKKPSVDGVPTRSPIKCTRQVQSCLISFALNREARDPLGLGIFCERNGGEESGVSCIVGGRGDGLQTGKRDCCGCVLHWLGFCGICIVGGPVCSSIVRMVHFQAEFSFWPTSLPMIWCRPFLRLPERLC
jgi:hypothetical protein